MHHLQHVLLSTLLVLTGYLAFQNQQLRLEVQALITLQQGSASILAETLTPIATKIDAINSVTSKMGKEADDAAKKKQALVQQRLDVNNILGTLKQANQLRTEGKGAEAADKLASTKKPIWQAGETFAAHKAKLQGLMGTLDKLIAAWKGGDTSTAPDAVSKVLEAVLGELGNEQK